MEDDNIIPYETSPTLTVKQAVMYIHGYRGDFDYETEEGMFEYDIYDFLRDMQEKADADHGNAVYELTKLKQDDNPSPKAIKVAEQKVATTKVQLEKANNLPDLVEKYRLLINHEIARVRLGKRTPLVIDEDDTGSSWMSSQRPPIASRRLSAPRP